MYGVLRYKQNNNTVYLRCKSEEEVLSQRPQAAYGCDPRRRDVILRGPGSDHERGKHHNVFFINFETGKQTLVFTQKWHKIGTQHQYLTQALWRPILFDHLLEKSWLCHKSLVAYRFSCNTHLSDSIDMMQKWSARRQSKLTAPPDSARETIGLWTQ